MSDDTSAFDTLLRHTLRIVQPGSRAWNAATMWERFEARAREESHAQAAVSRARVPRNVPHGLRLKALSPNVMRRPIVAASAAFAFGIAAMLLIRANRAESDSRSTPQSMRYATAPGQQATVTLHDGSRAVLGPNTTLDVTLGNRARGTTVSLTGQAIFTVVHHDRTPFTVRMGNAESRVLGTIFLARRYTTERAAQVVVAEGRVSVRHVTGDGKFGLASILSANTRAVISDSGNVQITPNVALDDYTAWTSDRLVFRATPARDVAAELARTYDVDIRIIDSSAAKQPLTWTVPVAARTITDVANGLAVLLDAHVIRSGRTIDIVPGRSASRKSNTPRHHLTPETQYGR